MRIKTHWKAFSEEELNIRVPDNWRIKDYKLPAVPFLTKEDISWRIEKAFNNDVIKDKLNGSSDVCILVDDLARPVEWEPILEVLCRQLQNLGVLEKAITLLIALAGHRQLSENELHVKLGLHICRRFRVEQHDLSKPMNWFDTGKYKTDINRYYTDEEFKVILGSVIPHPFADFSGGGKAILPRISKLESVCCNHSLAAFGQGKIADTDSNIRKQIDELSDLSGIGLLINAVCNGRRRNIELFCGQRTEAFSQAVDMATIHYGNKLEQAPDFVILNAYPKDLEIVQVVNVFNVIRTMDKKYLCEVKAVVIMAPVPNKIGQHALFAPGGVL
jgi:lactate racemase